MNVIPKPQLFGKNQMQAGEDVGECFLQSQSYGHTTDTQSSEDGGNGDAVVLEYHQYAHGVDDAVDDGIQERGLGHGLLGAFNLHIDNTAHRAGNNPGYGQDDDRKKDVGKNPYQWFNDVDGVNNPVKAYDQTKGNGNALQSINKDGLPRSFIAGQAVHNAFFDHAVKRNAGSKCCHQYSDGNNQHFQKMSPVEPVQPFHIRQNNSSLVLGWIELINTPQLLEIKNLYHYTIDT